MGEVGNISTSDSRELFARLRDRERNRLKWGAVSYMFKSDSHWRADTISADNQGAIISDNAGIMSLPKLEKQYDYEAQFFTNHMGHFILVTRLPSVLAPGARVVVVTSSAHVAAPPEGIRFDDLGGDRLYIPGCIMANRNWQTCSLPKN